MKKKNMASRGRSLNILQHSWAATLSEQVKQLLIITNLSSILRNHVLFTYVFHNRAFTFQRAIKLTITYIIIFLLLYEVTGSVNHHIMLKRFN